MRRVDTPIFWEVVRDLGPIPRAVDQGAPTSPGTGLAIEDRPLHRSPDEHAGEATTAPARPAPVKVSSKRLPGKGRK